LKNQARLAAKAMNAARTFAHFRSDFCSRSTALAVASNERPRTGANRARSETESILSNDGHTAGGARRQAQSAKSIEIFFTEPEIPAIFSALEKLSEIDPRLIFLARAAARLDLVETGVMELDEAFDGLVSSLSCGCSREMVERWEPSTSRKGRAA
jgi:hypothetical protein